MREDPLVELPLALLLVLPVLQFLWLLNFCILDIFFILTPIKVGFTYNARIPRRQGKTFISLLLFL